MFYIRRSKGGDVRDGEREKGGGVCFRGRLVDLSDPKVGSSNPSRSNF